MKRIWNTFKSFIKDDNGFEFLQLAIVIIIVAGLAVVVYAIADNARTKLEQAGDDILNMGSDTTNP